MCVRIQKKISSSNCGFYRVLAYRKIIFSTISSSPHLLILFITSLLIQHRIIYWLKCEKIVSIHLKHLKNFNKLILFFFFLLHDKHHNIHLILMLRRENFHTLILFFFLFRYCKLIQVISLYDLQSNTKILTRFTLRVLIRFGGIIITHVKALMNY